MRVCGVACTWHRYPSAFPSMKNKINDFLTKENGLDDHLYSQIAENPLFSGALPSLLRLIDRNTKCMDN